MRALGVIVAAVSLAACGAKAGTLSPTFRGLWAADAAACQDAESDARLDVTANRLVFYEWGGDVTGIRLSTQSVAHIDLDWWDVSDTDQNDVPIIRQKKAEMSVSSDRSALTLKIDVEAPQTYVRCTRNRL